jgi:MerR family transcriptional regulator/heat shock protein HspR
MVNAMGALERRRVANPRLSIYDLARAVSLSPDRIAKFVGVGLIEPCTKTRSGPLFSASSLDRLRRILRLRRDLGVNLAGAAVISDMRERIVSLQAELLRLRRRSSLLALREN